MRGRRGVAALAAVACVVIGVLAGNSPVDADDASTIDVDAEEVALSNPSNGKCSLAEAITNVSARAQVWTDCPSGAGVNTIHLPAGTYSVSADLPLLTQSVTFKGDGANTTALDGGSARRILNAQGPTALTIEGLTLRHGKSGVGGAVYAYNEPDSLVLTIRDSSFDDNQATADGGAIYLSGATLNVQRSSFNRNVAAKNGGAIGLPGGDTRVSIANSTFAANTAKYGGVVAARDASWDDPVTILNSTFVGNDASTANTGLVSAIKTVVIANSIVAKGGALKASCVTGSDAFAAGSGNNLTDDSSCTRFFSLVSALDLGTPGLHGGTTANFEPPAGSPAIDSGNDTICGGVIVGGVDQRGMTRTSQGAHCDIGAIEVQVAAEEPEGALVSAQKLASWDGVPGHNVTYTLSLTNSGDLAQGDNPGHEFTDVLPPGVTLLSASATSGTAFTDDETNTVWWDGAIAKDESVTITIVATVTAGLGETVSNQATISYDSDGDGANDASAVSDNPATGEKGDATAFVVQAPVIRVQKTVTTPEPYEPGGEIGYRIVISNEGNATASGVWLHDAAGPNTTLNVESVTTSAGTVDDSTDGEQLEVDVGDIAPGSQVEVTFSITVNSPVPAGTASTQNQAMVSGANFSTVMSDDDDDLENGVNPTVSTLETSPSLGIEMSGSTAAGPGEVVAYALDYSNTGNIGLDEVVIAADVPPGTVFAAGSSTTGWLCGLVAGKTVCELALGTLGGGAEGTVWFAVTIDEDVAAEAIDVSVSIVSGEVTAGTTASTSIMRPDVSAEITGPATANPSGTVRYPVTLTNTGGFVARDVTFTSTLPDGLAFSPGGDCTGIGQVVTCDAGEIDADGGAASVTIDATVAGWVADQAQLRVTGSVTWASGGGPTASNTVVTTVETIDLTAFVDGTAEAVPGETVVLSVIYANQGSATATGVWIEAILPPGTSLVAEQSPGWECVGSDCYLPLGTMAAGSGSTPFGVRVGDIGPDVEVLSVMLGIGDDGGHGLDTDTNDNTTAALISIVRPDLVVTLSGPDDTTPRDSFVFEAEVSNVGAAGVAAASLTDVLPASLAFDEATSSVGCTAMAQTVSCELGALGVDETTTVEIGVVAHVALRDGDSLSNQVTVGQATGEAVTSNNTSEVVTINVAAADLSVTVTGGGAVRPGSVVVFHVEVGNAGSLAANGAAVAVELADGMTFVSLDSSAGCGSTAQVVTCDVVGAVVAGGTASFDIAANVPGDVLDGAVLVSHVATTSEAPESASTLADNAADATTTVEYLLSVYAVIIGPADATTTDSLAYIVTVSNAGDTASFEFALTVGAGLAVDGVNADDGMTCEPLDAATNSIPCSGMLLAGSANSITVSAHLDGTQLDTSVSLTATGHAFTGEGDSPVQDETFAASAETLATRTVALGLTAQASPRTPMPASDVTYTIVAANSGDPLDAAQLTMTLPRGVEFKEVTSDGGMSCVGGQITVCSTGDAGWAEDAHATIKVMARVGSDAPAGTQLVLVATFEHSGGATSVSAAAQVAPPPPDIEIPVGPLPSGGGETFTYHLGFRWTLITWAGADGAQPGDALSGAGEQVADVVTAIYEWDAESGQWRGYFGGVPVGGANDLEGLQFGHVYWVAIDGITEAEWIVPLGGSAG